MWTSADFEQHATQIANAYIAGEGNGGGSLLDLVVKVARDHGLNPEQITRLSRLTNVCTFNGKYAALKGAGPRNPDFPVVRADDVIHQLHASVTSAKTAAAPAHYPDLPDPRRPPPVARPKTAAFVPATATTVDVDPVTVWFHLRKIAADARDAMHGAELRWHDAMTALQERGRELYFDRTAFEKNALAVVGLDCLPELNALRPKTARPLVVTQEKFAAVADRLVGSPDADTRLLKTAVEARTTYLRQHQFAIVAAEKFAAVDARVRGRS